MNNDIYLLEEKLNKLGINEFGIIDVKDYIRPRIYESMTEYYNDFQIKGNYDLSRFNSIIVFLLNYRPKVLSKENMSIGSNELDYHYVFREKANQLKEIFDSKNFEAFTDTGPLFDRSLALQAGLGFIGKNGVLINENIGSFNFIGYILTDIKYDKYVHNNNLNGCGDCDICLRSCPTGAISKNGFHPERCLAHITQTKNPDEKLLKRVSTFYGCDICQRCCPKNKDKCPGMSEFLSGDKIDYKDVFLLSNNEFKEKFGRKAFFWKGRKIIKRNAIVTATNRRDDFIIPILKEEYKKDNQYINYYIDRFFRELD